MARKQAVKTHHTPHPLDLCLLQDPEPTLPISPRKTAASLEVPLAVAMLGHHGQRGCAEKRGAQRPRLNRRAGSGPRVAKKALNTVIAQHSPPTHVFQ